MPAQVLTVDALELRRFFLRVEGDTITFGLDPGSADGMVRNLRIKGIRCEFDVSDDPVTIVTTDAAGRKADHLLIADEELRVRSSRLRILPTLDEIEELEEVVDEEETEPATHQFVVVNGADLGRVYPLIGNGVTRVGKDPKSVNIRLNDLYVAHIHCELEIDEDGVFVSHLNGSSGTFVNRQKIGGRTELQVGDIMRVGNSHLKLELCPANVEEPSRPVVDSWSSEVPAFREKRSAVATMQRPAATAPAPVAPPVAAPAPPPVRVPSALDKALHLENTTFGHFQVGEMIGRGRVGVVFRAKDLKTNQSVALKVLSPEFPKSDGELQHLGKIFKVAPTLRDSHLVTLLGVGRSGPFTWISRELIEGECLGKVLARFSEKGESSWKRACRVGAQVGAALDFLHQHKFVHGNLTPRNVLIRAEDNSVKLADALLVQALQGSHLHDQILTEKRDAEAVYLAPEQYAGPKEPDYRCDLYALGVLCYEVAVGQPPFVGASVEEVRAKNVAGAIAKPSRRHKDIPPPLEAAILRLLSRDPESRFQEVGEFLDIVEPILMMHDIK